MAEKIAVRSGWDRLRYTLCFELLLVISLSFALANWFDQGLASVGSLAIILSVKAMTLNYLYNLGFDRFDVSRGRVPTKRTVKWRIIHACGFELTLAFTSLPIVMWWLGIGLWQALLLDLIMMAGVVVYTFVFTLCYDKLFPVAQPQAPVGC